MLIESLIRLGRPLVAGGSNADEIVKQITDVAQDRAARFFSNVFAIEIDPSPGEFSAAALPTQQWGEYQPISPTSKKTRFVTDLTRAVGAPFVLPMGGNPTLAQGAYGVPVYPIYSHTVSSIAQAQSDDDAAKLAGDFVALRAQRTSTLKLTDSQLTIIGKRLAEAVRSLGITTDDKTAPDGLVILAVLTPNGPFSRMDRMPIPGSGKALVGNSMLHPGAYIVTDLDKVVEPFWAAKIEEGATGGELTGVDAVCSVCGSTGHVVSSYCKAWPWMSPTWEPPFAAVWAAEKKGNDIDRMVYGIALCDSCYKALTYGANVFLKLAARIDNWLVKELFSPSASPGGKETARQSANVESILGSAIALPILDRFIDDPHKQQMFVTTVGELLSRDRAKSREERHLKAITGLECYLPEGFDRDDFRLTVTYFSGSVSKGDIHLRSTIEDVIPSTAIELTRIVRKASYMAEPLISAVKGREATDKEMGYLLSRYGSLPYMLATAYGGPYLWSSLSRALHREPLSRSRFIMNSALRMSAAARHGAGGSTGNQQQARARLQDEVMFYLAFREFLGEYEKKLSGGSKEGDVQAMRDWRELVRMMSSGAPADMHFGDSEELGFACGYLTGLFSRQYWIKTKVGDRGKDFLKHRVMTFGTDLTPSVLYSRGLARMEELSRRLDFHLSEDFRTRLGIALAEYPRMKDVVARDPHSFIAAFWSGYNLCGFAKTVQSDDVATESAIASLQNQ
ncbi:MAG: hypothetical protein VB144_14495 [Clostridia bacterium]|nr:hypothetical protein [Clostridia bacterium]